MNVVRLYPRVPGRDITKLTVNAKVLLDVFSQHIVNFIVPRNWLFLAGSRIVIDVMPSAVSQQDAALLMQQTNKFITLQTAITLV